MTQVIEIVTGGWDVFIALILLSCSFAISSKETGDRVSLFYRLLLMANLLLQLSDLLGWIFRGNISILGYYMVRISNFCFYIGLAALPWTAGRFTCLLISDSFEDISRRFTRILNILAGTMVLLTCINLFNGWMYTFDEQNLYYRQPGIIFVLFNALCFSSVGLTHSLGWRYRKIRNHTIIGIIRLTCILVELAGAYQIFFYGISAFNIACTAGMLLLFTGILRQRSEIQRMEQLQLDESREKLAQIRQQMLQLQIQPHFMYNTIAAIQAQVMENPEEAYESIGIFSAFLRDTIHYSKSDQRIPIEEELDFSERLLGLAELRFGDKLNVEFDIRDTGFTVPPFTIQPLIENALNHGLKAFGHEGTICIRTDQRTENGQTDFIIEVEDNGAGMDSSVLRRLHKKHSDHIGMLNVKQRIEMGCKGQLEIVSPVPQYTESDEKTGNTQLRRRGTLIRIRIPK